MKVRCIDNKNNSSCLTIDKIYEVEIENDYYSLIDDRNRDAIYKKSRFEIVENTPTSPAQLGLDVLEIPSGVKHDSGKLKPTLLLDDMPLAIQEILKVLKFGAEKYSEGNWLKVDNGINRYRNAADRHRLESSINKIDDESGLLHLAHEATSILMLLELKLRGGK